MVIVVGNRHGNRVQILDDAVGISHSANANNVRQTRLFDLDMTIHLEGKTMNSNLEHE